MSDTAPSKSRLSERSFDDAYVQALFDRMGPTYDFVNVVSSFGFSEGWRRRCVEAIAIKPGERVVDLMAGSGECWCHALRRGAHLISIDFSTFMARRQKERNNRFRGNVDVRCENALHTSLWEGSVDCVVSAFGLKTLNEAALKGLVAELWRILKPGGRFSFLEISTAEGWWLAPLYRWYLNGVIPAIGRLCLGDIECYRMLGAYTTAFGSCYPLRQLFADVGFEVEVRSHFYGCATSLVGRKPGP